MKEAPKQSAPENWIVNVQNLPGKYRPEESINLYKTKISIVFTCVRNLDKDFLVIPFKNEDLELYPGTMASQMEKKISQKLNAKKSAWEGDDPEPLSIPTKLLGYKAGVILVKL